jgi:hypothetical protein
VRCRTCIFAFLALLTVAPIAGAGAADTDIESRRKAEQHVFSDTEIIEGFFKIAFGAEFRFGRQVDRIRKYDKPIRIFVDNQGTPDRHDQVSHIIADIRAHVKDLDIALTTHRAEANGVVTLVRDQKLTQTMRELYGTDRARRIQRMQEPQCLAGFTKDDTFRIVHSEIILVVDAGDFVFLDCAYEEILQALGPINDDNSVPWSMFNDEVSMGFFDLYDQILLNILYDPRVRPGMTRDDIRAVLPKVLPDVRAFVAQANNLNSPH